MPLNVSQSSSSAQACIIGCRAANLGYSDLIVDMVSSTSLVSLKIAHIVSTASSNDVSACRALTITSISGEFTTSFTWTSATQDVMHDMSSGSFDAASEEPAYCPNSCKTCCALSSRSSRVLFCSSSSARLIFLPCVTSSGRTWMNSSTQAILFGSLPSAETTVPSTSFHSSI